MPNADAESFPGVNNVERKTLHQGEIPPLEARFTDSHFQKYFDLFLSWRSHLKRVLFLGRRQREHIDDVRV